MNSGFSPLVCGILMLATAGCQHAPKERPFTNLFQEDGVPRGWIVRNSADVRNPHPDGGVWKVEHRILYGSNPRGSWLISEKEYGDFILEFEFKLGEQGNSGCGLRFPLIGNPAFEGIELQMVDPRYYGDQPVPPEELTGGLSRAVAPQKQLFRPLEWNKYEIACEGPWVKVALNGEVVLDLDLAKETKKVKRHEGSDAPALKDRPRRGHLGFQELSQGESQVQIRNVRIKELK